MWDDRQIDAAIDEAARQMTAGEPGVDFRARVIARIDAGSGLRSAALSFRSWRPALAGLSLVAAVFAIGLVVLRERPSPRMVSAPPQRLAPETTTVKPTDGAPKANARGAFEVAQGFSPAIAALKGCATSDCEPASARDDSHEVDTLDLPSIDLDSIAVTSLAASDSIHIDPLPPVPSIAVTPLDVENEGDRR
jgi:hypothetical protein